MKTQLLEDIGQSATLSLVPSEGMSNSESRKGSQDIARAPAAISVRPRSAFGVWRQKPDREPVVIEPVVIAAQQPDQPPPEATPAFEPVTAMEAQRVPPQPAHQSAISTVEPSLGANPTQSQHGPQGPVFDFTPPSPITPAPKLLKREPSWFERSGRRYLLWGACVLSGALAIQGGWWLYEQPKKANAPALVTDEPKAQPQLHKAVKRRAIGAKEFTIGPGGEVQVAPAAASASSAPAPTAQAVPPLVLLKPEPAAGARLEPTAALKGREELPAPPKPEHVAEQAPAAKLPKGVHRTGHEHLVPAVKPARARGEHAHDHQPAIEPVIQAEKKSDPQSAMSATLKACKEHGYQATQCVKQGCSMTRYGFVCRGK
jgi:hypothetical protein